MKAIEKARIAMVDASEGIEHLPPKDFFVAVNKAAITAYLDGILEDPEAIERVKNAMNRVIGRSPRDYAIAAIKALKQEAER